MAIYIELAWDSIGSAPNSKRIPEILHFRTGRISLSRFSFVPAVKRDLISYFRQHRIDFNSTLPV